MIMRFLPAIFLVIVLGFLGLATLEKNKQEQNPFTSPLIGQTVPIDTNATLTAQMFDPDKITIVNFFASWCVPCRVEHPQLMGLKQNKDVQLIGIAFKDKTENVQAFLNELGDPFDVVIQDPDGVLAVTWGIHGAPESFIIDKNNIIRHNHAGPVMERDLAGFVQKIERYK